MRLENRREIIKKLLLLQSINLLKVTLESLNLKYLQFGFHFYAMKPINCLNIGYRIGFQSFYQI